MANTPYSDIYDLFMQNIQDYTLSELYSSSPTNFATFLSGWLIQSIEEFSQNGCDQNLSNRNDTSGTFNFEMTLSNQVILAMGMVKFWLEREIQDVLQMKNNLDDHDFKRHSEAQNLKSKQDYYTTVQEKLQQKFVDYGLKRVDWDAWGSGNFS